MCKFSKLVMMIEENLKICEELDNLSVESRELLLDRQQANFCEPVIFRWKTLSSAIASTQHVTEIMQFDLTCGWTIS